MSIRSKIPETIKGLGRLLDKNVVDAENQSLKKELKQMQDDKDIYRAGKAPVVDFKCKGPLHRHYNDICNAVHDKAKKTGYPMDLPIFPIVLNIELAQREQVGSRHKVIKLIKKRCGFDLYRLNWIAKINHPPKEEAKPPEPPFDPATGMIIPEIPEIEAGLIVPEIEAKDKAEGAAPLIGGKNDSETIY